MVNDALQRILYVEDDADIRKIVSMSLEMVGDYTVAACGSCADALDVVDDFDPDLLLLDVMMPDVDGPTTLSRLRSRASSIATISSGVVMLSSPVVLPDLPDPV